MLIKQTCYDCINVRRFSDKSLDFSILNKKNFSAYLKVLNATNADKLLGKRREIINL